MRYSESVILAFARFTRSSDLVRETGLSKTTITRYRKDAELQRLAAERRMDIVRGAVYQLQSELTKSVETLAKVRDDPKVNAQVRVYAANCILNHYRDYSFALDISERVAALERAAKEAGGH